MSACPFSGRLGPRRTAPPSQRPEGFAPEYDAWEPRFRPGVPDPLLAVFGIEAHAGATESDVAEASSRLARLLASPGGPDVVERGTVRPGFGPRAEVAFAYWRSVTDYETWAGSAPVRDLWSSFPADGPTGVWREVSRVSLDHNETSYSRRNALTGIARFADVLEITEVHGYWGSARDRIVAAAYDSLAPARVPTPGRAVHGSGRGRRVRVVAPPNCCLIRTTQDVTQADPRQLQWYRAEVEPMLLAGVRHLRAHPRESGCLGFRFVEERDEQGAPVGRTCGVGWFDSLASLEVWTHRHPTHEAIMTSFVGMVKAFRGQPGLHLWHEITVFPAGHLSAEYVNCSDDGTLLAFAGAALEEIG